ncbi:unnamed protein product [Mytilus edulis]|uniref:B box-type domain-containing protein n=1 Tax=Mytilus edulis TaxID=6550 RepID=A0A8S3UGP2_MYTED|nr:unnamed protein product [Mytilus edulis]
MTRDMTLKDETGKSVLASHVFKTLINAFINDLMEMLNSVQQSDIRFVIPVSADLTDTDKQFLRYCAVQTGINSNNFIFVTKTEAAFMYCHQLQDRYHNQKLENGTEYMVVHIGGRGTELTVLMKDSNQVIEKYQIRCNDCGGTYVVNSFLEFLVRIFGSQLITSLSEGAQFDLLYIKREIERIKRSVNGKSKGKIGMTVPIPTLNSFCHKHHAKDVKEVVSNSIYGNGIRLFGDKMRIDTDIIHNLFKPTIDKIINLMKHVFADYKDAHKVKQIVMVGGFSECSLVQDAVRQSFSNKTIFIPNDPELAVMKGAVLCGQQPYQYNQLTSTEMKAAQASVTKCIFCDNPGVYHCTECKSAFCQECRTNHDKLPTAKNHTVTDLKKTDPSDFSTNAMCVLHKSEFIYFCTRCHVLICGKCVTTEHKGHDITDIKTVANDYRRRAEENISDLKLEVTKLSTVVEHMTKYEKPTIKIISETALAEIDAAAQKITKAVFSTKDNKIDEVQSQLDIETEEFQYDLKNKERIYEHQKTIYESLERLMSVSHDITFITSYDTLKRDIHDISDYVGPRGNEKLYKFDKKGFVQEVVTAIVSDFEMR